MNVLDKFSNIFFKEEDFEDEDMMDVEEEPKATKEKTAKRNVVWNEPEPKKVLNNRNNVMAIPTKNNSNLEMVLIKATTYDDMQTIANHIKAQRVAVVNFEEMDKSSAQRMVDFLSGAVFALDGIPRKVSGGTFIFSSSNVDLSGKIMDTEDNTAAVDDSLGVSFKAAQWTKK